MTQQDKNWSEYWQNEGAEGEVFVNKQGGKHPFLAQYWQQLFREQTLDARVIDIAAGAGSIFSHLPTTHQFDLHAADISGPALAILKQRIPATTVHVCPATELPLPDSSFDFVVSQFGVEYAGIDAFIEAARLVKPGGQLSLLCHYQDGYIDSKNQKMLEAAKIARHSNFISDALALVTSAFNISASSSTATPPAEAIKEQKNFTASQRTIEQAIKHCPEGAHAHLYFGFKQLYERRSAYDLADITNWLEEMTADIDRNIMRLTEMCNAASSQSDIEKITQALSERNFIGITQAPVILPEHKLPVAWAITAFKV